jgi:NAD(P)-dependent dehydrogenase (short-subunit alcohol dehydrogenase family)
MTDKERGIWTDAALHLQPVQQGIWASKEEDNMMTDNSESVATGPLGLEDLCTSGPTHISRRELVIGGMSTAMLMATGIARSETTSQLSDGRQSMKNVLVTGAGTGIGNEVAMRLAQRGYTVIAGVEIPAEVEAVKRQAIRRGVSLRVEKLDVTNEADRHKTRAWDIDILLNNAGISEGGSLVDVPEFNLRRQIEVNVFGPILLTQEIAKRMAERRSGRIVFVTSVTGLLVSPFTGPYSISKHCLEAAASALSKELLEFNVEVATVVPGPFLTGLNDRMFETWQGWEDDPSKRLFDYSKISFPSKQYDPEPVFDTAVRVCTGELKLYRNFTPIELIPEEREKLSQVWTRKTTDGLGHRDKQVQSAYDMNPGTPADSTIQELLARDTARRG